MAGNQFGFQFQYESDILELWSTLKPRLLESVEYYNLTNDDIVYVQLSFRKVDSKLLKEFK